MGNGGGENTQEIKSNQVWKTKEGRAVLIVEVHWSKDALDYREPILPKLGMLWYDEIDKNFTVSELMNRLDCLLETTAAEWFEQSIVRMRH